NRRYDVPQVLFPIASLPARPFSPAGSCVCLCSNAGLRCRFVAEASQSIISGVVISCSYIASFAGARRDVGREHRANESRVGLENSTQSRVMGLAVSTHPKRNCLRGPPGERERRGLFRPLHSERSQYVGFLG